jgi:hypothetical protein
VLDRAAVGDGQPADRRVVLPQDAKHLLRIGALRERREPAQVREERGDLAAVTGEELLALGR